VVDPCKYGNEHSNFVESGEFVDKLSDYELSKKNPTPWTYLDC
jgi:hypothetical protein